MAPTTASRASDPFELSRFVDAQDRVYPQALAELRQGRKEGHWMWFIFPQVAGLGFSETARYYAIRSREEAAAYLDHPVLGPRLLESGETLLALPTGRASEIFGGLDAMKLKSCMTLFAEVAQQHSVFQDVLARYFHGERDHLTVDILKADWSRRQGPLPNR